jgi:hypothetical protein
MINRKALVVAEEMVTAFMLVAVGKIGLHFRVDTLFLKTGM